MVPTPTLFTSPPFSLLHPLHPIPPIRSSPYSKPPNLSPSPWPPRLKPFSDQDRDSLSLKRRSVTGSVDRPPPAADLR
ncbi:hypothetical protein ACFX2F_030028 [Malus domestica]